MSVVPRLHSIPQQRSANSTVELDAPAPSSRAGAPPGAAPRRRRIALLATGAAVVAAGTGASVVLDAGAAAPTNTVTVPGSELSRDAAAALRGPAPRMDTEARRDAAWASRGASG